MLAQKLMGCGGLATPPTITSFVAGAVAFGTTTLSIAKPAVAVGDRIMLMVGFKGTVHDGGTLTNVSGFTSWSLNADKGGYATTGVDTGNVTLASCMRTVDGTEGSTFSVTLNSINVAWGCCVLGRAGTAGTLSFSSSGALYNRTAGAATVDMTGSVDTVGSGYIIGFVCPTDANTFTAGSATATGKTLTLTELRECNSATGNDIGGFIYHLQTTAADNFLEPQTASWAINVAGSTTNNRGALTAFFVTNIP